MPTSGRARCGPTPPGDVSLLVLEVDCIAQGVADACHSPGHGRLARRRNQTRCRCGTGRVVTVFVDLTGFGPHLEVGRPACSGRVAIGIAVRADARVHVLLRTELPIDIGSQALGIIDLCRDRHAHRVAAAAGRCAPGFIGLNQPLPVQAQLIACHIDNPCRLAVLRQRRRAPRDHGQALNTPTMPEGTVHATTRIKQAELGRHTPNAGRHRNGLAVTRRPAVPHGYLGHGARPCDQPTQKNGRTHQSTAHESRQALLGHLNSLGFVQSRGEFTPRFYIDLLRRMLTMFSVRRMYSPYGRFHLLIRELPREPESPLFHPTL